jgi:hypothetical protein
LRRNCHIKHVIEGKMGGGIEVAGRRGKISRQIVDDLMKREVTGNSKRKH